MQPFAPHQHSCTCASVLTPEIKECLKEFYCLSQRHAIKVDNENESILKTGREVSLPPGFVHSAIHWMTAKLGPGDRKAQTATVIACQNLCAVARHSEVFPHWKEGRHVRKPRGQGSMRTPQGPARVTEGKENL